ncbi:3-hydroxyacyl-CoA dehydrogenase family protein [Oceanobacillus alkalisoli]|uniref:3-hydroxyacyl-CoA dehydrogenase family protein n=1 Tax=Oceanobacillus alkalisoli TaxID=2925113 RepID=UPI001F11BBD4|nr:3-hydroxyacyl-CoA dehydrogenase NAD-binding domain-containing protein [Oceanobacillus alkalisoli]MCF3942598.1 3-hydroxyacyl-CoA dehydrogenase NAD-binding domain-containing protein [Oceanobacillus alkalisoli]
MDIKRIAVIGGGLMGAGIAQNAAESGRRVTIIEVNEDRAAQSLKNIEKQLNRKVEKSRIDEQAKQKALDLIEAKTSMDEIKDAEIVIEAVPEELSIKKDTFAKIDQYANENAILASNTSGLSIAAIGAATSRPEKVIGFHYFYPVPVMGLVEVIPSIITDQSTIDTMYSFAEIIDKKPVLCQDYPGFIVNRLLIPMVNEAAYLVMEGADPRDVDNAMKLGANHRMGPITLADFVGLDVLLATMEGLYQGFQDSKYRPCPLLKKIVESGNYGKKTGRGFYQYDNDGNQLEPVIGK